MPKGKILTKTYMSYKTGYRLAYLSEMGVALPPLPYNLHQKAHQKQFPKEDTLEEALEPASSRQNEEEPLLINYQHQVPINPFGSHCH